MTFGVDDALLERVGGPDPAGAPYKRAPPVGPAAVRCLGQAGSAAAASRMRSVERRSRRRTGGPSRRGAAARRRRRGGPRRDESTIATISRPSTVTWSSSSLPRYSTTSAVPWSGATGAATRRARGAPGGSRRSPCRRPPATAPRGSAGGSGPSTEPRGEPGRSAGRYGQLDEVHRRAADEAGHEAVDGRVVERPAACRPAGAAPSLMTAMRSPMVMASTWSWVT